VPLGFGTFQGPLGKWRIAASVTSGQHPFSYCNRRIRLVPLKVLFSSLCQDRERFRVTKVPFGTKIFKRKMCERYIATHKGILSQQRNERRHQQ
jgi:hypothetical protein